VHGPLMGPWEELRQVGMAMQTTARFEIPENLAPIEIEPNVFISPALAKVKHWRAALKDWHNEGAIPQQRQIKQMIEIADALRLSDDVVLLPHLVSLRSAENVVAIKPRR
jgi:hypothetical protein